MSIKATEPMALLQEIKRRPGAVRASPLWFPDRIDMRRTSIIDPPAIEFREPGPVEMLRRPEIVAWPHMSSAALMRIEIDAGPAKPPGKRPRWGQPGRHRRRKARLAARRLNEQRQRERAEWERFAEHAQSKLARDHAVAQARLERQAVEAALRPAQAGPWFDGAPGTGRRA